MSEFTEFLHEVFAGFGPITLRRMFGGHGVYHQGLMFGLVADDVLYLKADEQNRQCFEVLGLAPFEYGKDGKVMKLSYYAAPPSLMDDMDEAADWARRSYEAALRARSKLASRAGNRRLP